MSRDGSKPEADAGVNERIEFNVPLPPPPLRANFRGHWSKRSAAAKEYSAGVVAAFSDGDNGYFAHTKMPPPFPWERAKVSYEWRYCGTAPDLSNMGGHTKYLQDYLCMAPDTGKLMPNRCTYLGLIENDRGIEPSWTLVKVAHRRDELVRVRIMRV